MSFNWVEKDRELHKRDFARAYGFAKRDDASDDELRSVHHFIGGKHVPGQRGLAFPDHNPATGKVHATIARGDAQDIDAAVAAAKSALPAWAALSIDERCRFLDRIADVLERDEEHIARLESMDTGKPIHWARTMDARRSAQNFRFYAKHARAFRDAEHPMPNHTNRTHRKPLGVVGLVTPWNLPLYLLTWKVAPALAMGNTIVAKPSELTPLTADYLTRAATEAGLPAGVLNLVHGYGHEAGQALVEHPDVKAISFTGGTVTGRKVAATAAAGLKKISLELGGKNATIVFADCDLDATIAGVLDAAFRNQGQICLCGSRILVEKSIEPEFTKRLTTAAKALPIGDPLQDTTRIGALISPDHQRKVESYIRLAKDEGGQILTGGKRPELPPPHDGGNYLEPTLIKGLPETSRCIQEEIFGPVATLQTFTDENEAIHLANGTPYGLAASIWTRDNAKAQRVAEALDTGMVWINCWLIRELAVPFGGMKQSGIGREGGNWSLEFFSEPRNICTKQ